MFVTLLSSSPMFFAMMLVTADPSFGSYSTNFPPSSGFQLTVIPPNLYPFSAVIMAAPSNITDFPSSDTVGSDVTWRSGIWFSATTVSVPVPCSPAAYVMLYGVSFLSGIVFPLSSRV